MTRSMNRLYRSIHKSCPQYRAHKLLRRCFSYTSPRRQIKVLAELPPRIRPSYTETRGNDLLSLQWPSAPRNILLVKKEHTAQTAEAVLEFAKHVHSTYPSISFILESTAASELNSSLPFPIYSFPSPPPQTPSISPIPSLLPKKVDLIATFGGDGTILHASSLFATHASVPPVLSFSMGTLGFLTEWKFAEYKRAFRELYMSGAPSSRHEILSNSLPTIPSKAQPTAQNHPSTNTWPSTLGASLGPTRSARVLLRNRLRIALTSPSGQLLTPPHLHALNEIILHRGASPHLTHLTLSLSGRPLTLAVADGLIISTPTGSTAYSLSAGGSIVHPLVKGIVITPICARSLSFRPLVLPGEAQVEVHVEGTGRGSGVEVSIDGVGVGNRTEGIGAGTRVKVWGEGVGRRRDLRERGEDVDDGGVDGSDWVGGVPCVMRGDPRDGASGDEGWVGGLNGLLKFNYPFGEES